MSLFPFRDMLSSLRVNVEISQAEIEQVYLLLRKIIDSGLLFLSQTHLFYSVLRHRFEDKVLRLDISVDHTAVMNLL